MKREKIHKVYLLRRKQMYVVNKNKAILCQAWNGEMGGPKSFFVSLRVNLLALEAFKGIMQDLYLSNGISN